MWKARLQIVGMLALLRALPLIITGALLVASLISTVIAGSSTGHDYDGPYQFRNL